MHDLCVFSSDFLVKFIPHQFNEIVMAKTSVEGHAIPL